MKSILILFLMFFLVNTYVKADVSLSAFNGDYGLESMKGSNFFQSRPYCASDLEVEYDTTGSAKGLHFTDVSTSWVKASDYFSLELLQTGRKVSDDTEESISLTAESLIYAFTLNKGNKSYVSIKTFKISGRTLFISEKIDGRTGLFSSKLDCLYKRK